MTQASTTARDRAPDAAPRRRSRRAAAPAPAPRPRPRHRPLRSASGSRRFVLLVVLPVVAVALGVLWWLSGGRYVSTDNAYVGADKALITPYVTGPIVAIHVKEGQEVKVGDPLFDIDPAPYETALALAQGRLDAAKVEFANLKASYASNIDQIKMGEQVGRAASGRFRPQARAGREPRRHAGRRGHFRGRARAGQADPRIRSRSSRKRSRSSSAAAPTLRSRPSPTTCRPRRSSTTPSATSATPTSRRRSPASRRRSPQIELGRVAPAGQPVFAIVADKGLWVDANPKESDLTYVTQGLPATRDDRHLPRTRVEGHGLLDRARHRRAIRDPAAAERQRQLGQGRPAHAAALLLRRPMRTRRACAPA